MFNAYLTGTHAGTAVKGTSRKFNADSKDTMIMPGRRGYRGYFNAYNAGTDGASEEPG